MNRDEIFADAVSGIGLVAGMVRIDFVSLSATEKDSDGKPAMVFRQRVVMPPEGFLRTFGAMQNLLNQLEKAGVVTRKAGSAEAEVVESGKPKTGKPKSPNFD